MSAFLLKTLAMTTMLIDHIGFRFAGNLFWMRFIGRIAFILYAFLTAEAYCHLKEDPKRLRRHIGKLILLCVVSEIPHDVFSCGSPFCFQEQNVILTLTLGFLALAAGDRWTEKLARVPAAGVRIALFLPAAVFACLIRAEYDCAGVVLVGLFALYLQRTDTLGFGGRLAALAGVLAVYLAVYTWAVAGFSGWAAFTAAAVRIRRFYPGMLLPILPIAAYRRELGFHGRWFRVLYSWFYPAHLLILFLLARFV